MLNLRFVTALIMTVMGLWMRRIQAEGSPVILAWMGVARWGPFSVSRACSASLQRTQGQRLVMVWTMTATETLMRKIPSWGWLVTLESLGDVVAEPLSAPTDS